MTFDVEIAGRPRRISIQADGAADAGGGRFRVRIDDEEAEVEMRRTDLGLLLVFADGRTADVALTPRAAGEWFVQLPHVGLTAVVDGRRRGSGAAVAGSSGPQRIVAPMPGRVVRVLVKPGDQVAARQGVVVVEAMKMENELTAVRPGTVKDVAIAEGASVEAGRLLVVIE